MNLDKLIYTKILDTVNSIEKIDKRDENKRSEEESKYKIQYNVIKEILNIFGERIYVKCIDNKILNVTFKKFQLLKYLSTLNDSSLNQTYNQLAEKFNISVSSVSRLLKRHSKYDNDIYYFFTKNKEFLVNLNDKEYYLYIVLFFYIEEQIGYEPIRKNGFLKSLYNFGLKTNVLTKKISNRHSSDYVKPSKKIAKNSGKDNSFINDFHGFKPKIFKPKKVNIIASYKNHDTIKKLAEHYKCKIYEKPKWVVDTTILYI